MNILITLLFAFAFGILFLKRKVPGGMMVGAVFGTVLLSLISRTAQMPYIAKFLAQTTAGMFIGCSISKDDLFRVKEVSWVVFFVLGSFFALNLSLGILLSLVTEIDLLTAFLCAVPGGMSDVPLTAADMGADVSTVVILQFTRLCVGVGVFPSWIVWLDGRRNKERKNQAAPVLLTSVGKTEGKDKEPLQPGKICLVCLVAISCGWIGKKSGIPAGTLIMSMLGTMALSLARGKTRLPKSLKRVAQALSGAYIGCSIGYEALFGIPSLIIPAILVAGAYLANAYLMGSFLHKKYHMPFREALLMLTPAGASDMALLSADLGVQSPVLIVTQLARLMAAASVFPQICYFLYQTFAV